MKIVICEDDNKDAQCLSRLLSEQCEEWRIVRYDNAESLLDSYAKGKEFDLIFLDIFMGEINGMCAAEKLRKLGCDTPIIFLTSSSDFALSSYKVRALSYIVKPIDQNSLANVLGYFFEQYRPKNIRIGNKVLKASDILYIESKNKKVKIHLTRSKTEEFTAKLNDVAASIIAANFMRCHRSFIINMDAVLKIERDKFLMSDNVTIPIRRQETQQLINQYYDYITS